VAKRARTTDERGGVVLTDPRAIRALAHPARLAVIEELYAGRELTATECADIAGLSPSAMSYHLRSLEKAGIVERADASGDGRERPWRAAGRFLQVDSGSGPGGLAASEVLTKSILGRTLDSFDNWMAHRDEESKEWLDAAGGNYAQLYLTTEEANELTELLRTAMERYRDRRTPEERPPGARRVRVAMLTFPVDEPPGQ
jgi:DNA-binding transcriptional ArsR family regulator